MRLFAKVALTIFCTTVLSGCATYHVTTQSLMEQAAKTTGEKKTLVFVALPFFYAGTVNGNNFRYVECLDKKGEVKKIRVTHHTGIRITKNDNSRKTFYFDTLIIKDSVITGSVTHFGNIQIKPIKLKDIAKIEIQK